MTDQAQVFQQANRSDAEIANRLLRNARSKANKLLKANGFVELWTIYFFLHALRWLRMNREQERAVRNFAAPELARLRRIHEKRKDRRRTERGIDSTPARHEPICREWTIFDQGEGLYCVLNEFGMVFKQGLTERAAQAVVIMQNVRLLVWLSA